MKENWENHWKDYYQILQVHPSAEQEIISAAYRKLADKYHPDHNPDKQQWANEKFKEINEAYEILGDIEKRKYYDSDYLQRMSKGNIDDFNNYSSMQAKSNAERPIETYSVKEDKLTGKNPKIEIYPKVINLKNSLPYVKRTASFFIRNVGGPYKKILIGPTPEWVKITNTKALYDGSKLPLQIQLEATGIQWNKEYSTEIRVRLDESETLVIIRLRTERKPS